MEFAPRSRLARRAIGFGASLLATAAVPLSVLPSAATAAGGCANIANAAVAAPAPAMSAAVRCLVNQTRAAHGLRALRPSARLERAAERHGQDMVRRRYFDHDSPGGRGVTDRVRSTGYLRGAGDWALGEDLGWGTGSLSSPAAIVQAWMDSPPHRAVILNGRYREVGVGIVQGVPVPMDATGATFVMDVGVAR
ncbi:MAG: hypothetical protein QOH46_4219 [Solirubrobacteraceae bacterium]|nr:hypothetical protein [Solirubrobacteraceae bacterium]